MTKAASNSVDAEDFDLDTAVQAPGEPSDALNERYGRTPRDRRTKRIILSVVGAAFVVVLAAWVVWGALGSGTAGIEGRDVAHSIIDQHNIDVTVQVTAPAGTEVYCVIEALNDGFTVVGTTTVAVPASEHLVRTISQSIVTTELASTGTVKKCLPLETR